MIVSTTDVMSICFTSFRVIIICPFMYNSPLGIINICIYSTNSQSTRPTKELS